MKAVDAVHAGYVHERRVRVLARHLAEVIPQRARVLDIGCGDGWIASRVLERRPDLTIVGMDVLVRPAAHIAVTAFDGRHLPVGPREFDAAMLIDVLHHTDDPASLLREANRVVRRSVVVKDHLRDGWLAGPTLRLMDQVGNARHGVALPHNYWSRDQWTRAIAELGMTVGEWRTALQIYPRPADWVFGRGLHFLARLDRSNPVGPGEPDR